MRTEDGYIIQQCLDGNSAAFGLLVDKYKKSIYALAYSEVHSFHDAQDIAQEVFIRAYEKLRTLKRWDNFVGWLHRITINLCKNWLRSASRRPDREFVEDQDPSFLDHPSVDSYREDMVYDSIREALDSLPEEYRQVLTLRHFGGMNVREMARFLGISPSTIDRRLREARIQLKEEMVGMMGITYGQHSLPANFTFRIVEMVKRIRIHAMPKSAGLPWGLSLAAGSILVAMTVGSQMVINELPKPVVLANETNVAEVREIPVDILGAPGTSVIAGRQGDIDGGKLDPRNSQNAFLLAPAKGGGTWTEKGNMPTARWAPGSAVVDGKIYAIGGTTGAFAPSFSTVEVYDPATDTWTKKANMPTGRAFLGVSVVDGKIYAIGGSTALKGGIKLAAVEEYDPATDTWTKKADMPIAKSSLGTSVVNGKIYVIGGSGGGVQLSTVEEYDPATDIWTKKADMPTARSHIFTSVVNGKIYAFGGVTGNAWPAFSTLEEYDPVTDTWTKKADMPAPRASSTSVVVDEKIYAFGGVDRRGGTPLSTLFQYDPATDTWTAKDDMPVRMTGVGTSVVGRRIYIIGGTSTPWPYDPPTSTVWEYDTGFVTVPAEEARSVGPERKLTTPLGKIRSK